MNQITVILIVFLNKCTVVYGSNFGGQITTSASTSYWSNNSTFTNFTSYQTDNSTTINSTTIVSTADQNEISSTSILSVTTETTSVRNDQSESTTTGSPFGNIDPYYQSTVATNVLGVTTVYRNETTTAAFPATTTASAVLSTTATGPFQSYAESNWLSVGFYSYKLINGSLNFTDLFYQCALINGTVPTFYDIYDWFDFIDTKSILSNKTTQAFLGYKCADTTDPCLSVYDNIENMVGNPLPNSNTCVTGNSNVTYNNTYSVVHYFHGSQYCSRTDLVPICQQMIPFSEDIVVVPCAQLCQTYNTSSKLHQISLLSQCTIGSQSPLINAYAATNHIPDFTVPVFIMAQANNTQIAFGETERITFELQSYTMRNVFFVVETNKTANLKQYSLLRNCYSKPCDTVIVETGSADYTTLTISSILNDTYFGIFEFYLFTKLSSSGVCSLQNAKTTTMQTAMISQNPSSITSDLSTIVSPLSTVETTVTTQKSTSVKTTYSTSLNDTLRTTVTTQNASSITPSSATVLLTAIVSQNITSIANMSSTSSTATMKATNKSQITTLLTSIPYASLEQSSNTNRLTTNSTTTKQNIIYSTLNPLTTNSTTTTQNVYSTFTTFILTSSQTTVTIPETETTTMDTTTTTFETEYYEYEAGDDDSEKIVADYVNNTVEVIIVQSVQSLGCIWIISMTGISLLASIILRSFTIEKLYQIGEEVTLLLAHILMFIFLSDSEKRITCKIVSILVEYFFLTNFCFVLLESMQTMCIITNVILSGRFAPRKYQVAFLLVVPSACAAITAAVGWHGLAARWACVLNLSKDNAAGILIPSFVINVISFVTVDAAGTGRLKALPLTNKAQRLTAQMNYFGLLLKILINMAAWFLGLYAVYYQKFALYIIVFGLNMCNGIVIIWFHALANEKVRKLYLSFFRRLIRKMK